MEGEGCKLFKVKNLDHEWLDLVIVVLIVLVAALRYFAFCSHYF